LLTAAPRRELISFGIFEIDPEAGEIRKAGVRVRLQVQPFRVLVALLSKAGEVVTREQLQHEIWGDNTTVDFERGIASAINKIRDALGDSADNPVFIETLSKRGYRFIAPVVVSAHPLPVHEAAVSDRVPPIPLPPGPPTSAFAEAAAVPPAPLPDLSTGPANERRIPSRRFIWVFAAVVPVLLITLFALYELPLRFPAPGRPPRLRQIATSGIIYNGPPDDENHVTLATDGARIYTSFLVQGRAELSSMNIAGTELQPVSLPEELGTVSLADISPDGLRLIVKGQSSRGSEQPLWIVPTSGGSALRVGAVLAHDATFMPGGAAVLFASGDTLGVVSLDAGTETPYATLPGRAFWPRWSPDGTTLRFTLLDPISHSSSLWEIDAVSRRPHRLSFPDLAGASVCCGSWTANGKSYVFEATDEDEHNIWIAGAGAHPRLEELTNGPFNFVSPLPARDQDTVYFAGIEQPSGDRVYDAKIHQFVPAAAFLGDAGKVSYSRDGRWVAWTDSQGNLWRARSSDGMDRLTLTENLEVFLAQWSPDGQQLLLMARKPGSTWQIYKVSAAGGEVHLLLADQRNLADPDWSPDGKTIVFGRQAELMGKETGPNLIQTLDLNTRKVQSLPGSENLFSPRWSPDGRWILALSLDQTRLLLYDVKQRTWRQLFKGGVADPVWSGDSRAIFFHSAGVGIMRVALTGAAKLLTDPSKAGLRSDNYRFSGVTPAGAPIVEPGIGTGKLYAVRLDGWFRATEPPSGLRSTPVELVAWFLSLWWS
jgi:Tol biopolymer transport system component/DNA-binding winged helix-turn-helix (wHTH) protein